MPKSLNYYYSRTGEPFVTPVQAGVQLTLLKELDSRLRGNDGESVIADAGTVNLLGAWESPEEVYRMQLN